MAEAQSALASIRQQHAAACGAPLILAYCHYPLSTVDSSPRHVPGPPGILLHAMRSVRPMQGLTQVGGARWVGSGVAVVVVVCVCVCVWMEEHGCRMSWMGSQGAGRRKQALLQACAATAPNPLAPSPCCSCWRSTMCRRC